MILKYKYFIMI